MSSAHSPKQAASGVLWSGVSQAGRVLIQTATLVVLSRLLPPTDFGLLAMAAVVTAFVNLLRDMGTASAVIQRDILGPELLDTVFWFNIGLGITLAILVVLLSIPIAAAFHQPRLAGVLIALAASFPIASSAAAHQALMERELQFRTLARIEISSALTALAVAAVAALNGLGVYSLVLNALTATVISTVQLWLASSWRPTARWDREQFRQLWGFSGNLASFQVLNYLARNADTMLIGRFLGATDLAWYNMGYKLMLFPLTNLSAVVFRSLFPVLSRKQNDVSSFAALYLKATGTIALFTAPLMAGVWVLRKPFVAVVFGEKWLPVADVLGWLAPIGFMQSVLSSVGLIYLGVGQTATMMKWGVFASTATLLGFLVGLQWGYLGVARSYAVVNLLLFYPGFAIPLRLLGLRFTDLLKSIAPQVLTAIVMAVLVGAIDLFFTSGESPVFRLSVLTASGLCIYVAAAYLFMRSNLQALLGSLQGMAQ
ncbi:MAG: lipopolysaccharide biosynthesis protein [Proteobacteria bacterium]|nr:lipopolysaccharide biosynthesis protein [Pseudomonadota bacterium]